MNSNLRCIFTSYFPWSLSTQLYYSFWCMMDTFKVPGRFKIEKGADRIGYRLYNIVNYKLLKTTHSRIKTNYHKHTHYYYLYSALSCFATLLFWTKCNCVHPSHLRKNISKYIAVSSAHLISFVSGICWIYTKVHWHRRIALYWHVIILQDQKYIGLLHFHSKCAIANENETDSK